MSDLAQLKKELRETRREMKEKGIRKTSCFNGGLSPDEYRLNARLFELKTKIEKGVS